MQLRAEEISQIIKKQIQNYEKVALTMETGTVLSIGDVHVAIRRRRVVASDIVGVAALAVLLVVVGRGSVSTSSLDRVVDPSLVAVPVLAAVALAALVARLVPLVLRATANASPRRWPLGRLREPTACCRHCERHRRRHCGCFCRWPRRFDRR